MKAFLHKVCGEWLDDFVFMSKQPLIRLGFEIIEYDEENLEDTFYCYPIEKEDIIIGSVEMTINFLNELGIEPPKYLGYPDELKPWLKRDIKVLKFQDLPNTYPYFIKPYMGVKQFTGDIIEKESNLQTIKHFDNLPDDYNELVYCSDCIDIISEYRCFIFENKLMGIQYYKGDFKQYPNVDEIENMISSWQTSPVAYTLDVGVLKDGSTALVEVNDMWAIGSYGFNSRDYTLMCVRRLREIINSSI